MNSVRETLARATERLKAAGIESARLDARVLLTHAMGLSSNELLLAGAPSAEQLAFYETLIVRRAAREPLAYVTGTKEFWSLAFEVGPDVLIPRPETEALVEQVLRAFPDRSRPLQVLDLGTGSGCLLIAVLSEYPQAHGVGVDESEAALRQAQANADRNGVAQRCSWLKGGWTAAEGRTFDFIVSNPPYLAQAERNDLSPEIAQHEPPGALFAGEDGLEAYRALGPAIAASLRPGGSAMLEIGAGQEADVCAILAAAGLEIAHVAPDLSGIPRCVVVRRISDAAGPAAEKTVGNRRSSR